MKDKRDLAGCAVWLILSVFVFTASLRLGVGELRSPGPGFIPLWAGSCLAFFACIQLGFALLAKTRAVSRENRTKRSYPVNPLIVIAALALYCLTLERAGYLIATSGLMMVLFSLGKMKFRAIVLGSLVTSLSSYGLFAYLLGTPLPRGVLGF